MTKTIFITGASSGLGKATARFFARQGWQVAATLRTPGKEQELGKLPNVQLFELDVTQADQARRAVAAAVDAFGKIDVVVNNAGGGSYGPLEFASEETIDWQFQLNVRGAVLSSTGIQTFATTMMSLRKWIRYSVPPAKTSWTIRRSLLTRYSRWRLAGAGSSARSSARRLKTSWRCVGLCRSRSTYRPWPPGLTSWLPNRKVAARTDHVGGPWECG